MKKIPKPGSQTEEVLHSLLTRITITRQSMMIAYSVLNLPDVIHKLRRYSFLDIELTFIDTINKHGEPVRYGSYSLNDKKKGLEVYHLKQSNRLSNGV